MGCPHHIKEKKNGRPAKAPTTVVSTWAVVVVVVVGCGDAACSKSLLFFTDIRFLEVAAVTMGVSLYSWP